MVQEEKLIAALKAGKISDVSKSIEVHRLVGCMRWSEMLWIQHKLQKSSFDPSWKKEARKRLEVTKEIINHFYPVYHAILQFFESQQQSRGTVNSEVFKQLHANTCECLRMYDELYQFISELETLL
ncbi:hypothetical protein WDW89_07400 [Deltaproteobacteria bacterium TL4]